MPYNAPMYIEIVPNRNSPPAVLLREGWREGAKTLKRTLANLSHWPQQKIDSFRRLLQDELLVSPQDLFCTIKTLPHGHVEAILMAMRKLGMDSLLAAKPCRERDLVMAVEEKIVADEIGNSDYLIFIPMDRDLNETDIQFLREAHWNMW